MAEQANIMTNENFFIGEDKILEFTIRDEDGAVLDITGWTLEWILRVSAGTPSWLTKTTGAGITLTTPVSGICQVTIADTDTDAFPPGDYWHVLRRTTAGSEQVLSYGLVKLQVP